MNNQHRRIFSHPSNATENKEENKEGDIDQAVSKLNSKLISELAKRHSKLAKNVLESHEDRIEQLEGYFLEDDEELSDYEYYNNGKRYVNVEEDAFFQEKNDEFKHILEKGKKAGYLNGNNTDPDLIETEIDETQSNSELSKSFNALKKATTEILIDPNYGWLLKDLNLNNDKRVIDVTEMIELNESKQQVTSAGPDNESEPENEKDNYRDYKVVRSNTNSVTKVNQEDLSLSNNNQSNSEPEERQKELTTPDDANSESEPDECKRDNRFINALYEKLVAKNAEEKTNMIHDKEEHEEQIIVNEDSKSSMDEDNDNTEYDVGNNITYDEDGVYKKWSERYRSNQNNTTENEEISNNNTNNIIPTDLTVKPKKSREFSKSFEISLGDIDQLTDRVDSGIKLKRNKEKHQKQHQVDMTMAINEKLQPTSVDKIKTQTINSSEVLIDADSINTCNTHAFIVNPVASSDKQAIIESLKEEWSTMFNKLENDYQNKLNNQQVQNENRLKELHDEIKQSILIQQQQMFIERNKTETMLYPVKASMEPSLKYHENEDSQITTNGSSSFMDYPKSIQNIRIELKNKHTRHIQDLKEYYEKELDEMRAKLHFYENKCIKNECNSSTNTDDVETTDEENARKTNEQQSQQALNNELKSSNNALLNKLYKSGHHIRYLTQENCDLAKKIKDQENELSISNEKIDNLENCCNQLELQLTETIKLQNQYIRELHLEKRNIVKKMQECEELKMGQKFYEQKCESYELKLDERDSVITRLKTQLIQLETDLARLEFEYKKSINKYSSNSNLSQFNCQEMKQNKQISKHVAIKSNMSANGLVVSTGSPTSSSSSMSPASPKSRISIPVTTNSSSSQQYLLKNRSPSPATNIRFGSTNQDLPKRLSLNNPRVITSNASMQHSNSFTAHGNDENNFEIQYNHEIHAQSQNRFAQPKSESQMSIQQRQRRMSISPRRLKNTNNTPMQNYYEQQLKKTQAQQQNLMNDQYSDNFFEMEPIDKKLKYIQHMEYEFDMLMKHKQQLDAKLTRLPYKTTNANMQNLRESVESELDSVEKKLNSVKLELRKLNIIKSH